jgi:hypothetical protein
MFDAVHFLGAIFNLPTVVMSQRKQPRIVLRCTPHDVGERNPGAMRVKQQAKDSFALRLSSAH